MLKIKIPKICLFLLTLFTILIYQTPGVKAEQGQYTDVLPAEDKLIELTLNQLENPVKLPHGDLLTQFIPQAINIALFLTSSLLLIAFVYAGVVYVISQGNEEKINTAKKILSYAGVGLIIISSSYAITLGISKLAFD